MTTYYREPNRLKRLWNSLKEDFEDSPLGRWCAKHWRVWKEDRYLPSAKLDERTPLPIYRIRFWPVHLVQIAILWLGYNLMLVAWFMIAAIYGRTVSFKPIDGLNDPLVWFLEMLR